MCLTCLGLDYDQTQTSLKEGVNMEKDTLFKQDYLNNYISEPYKLINQRKAQESQTMNITNMLS